MEKIKNESTFIWTQCDDATTSRHKWHPPNAFNGSSYLQKKEHSMCILFIFSPSYRHAQKTFQATYCIKMPKRALGKSYCTQDKKLLKNFLSRYQHPWSDDLDQSFVQVTKKAKARNNGLISWLFYRAQLTKIAQESAGDSSKKRENQHLPRLISHG